MKGLLVGPSSSRCPPSVWALLTLACGGCGSSGAVAPEAGTSPLDAAEVGAHDDARAWPDSSMRDASDAAAEDSAADRPDVLAPVDCDGGALLLTIHGPSGTVVATGGCDDAGADAPWVVERSGGGTCFWSVVSGCGAGAQLTLTGGCNSGQLPAGQVQIVHATYELGGQGATGQGVLEFQGAPPPGDVVPGNYSVSLAADGGTIWGSFCATYLGAQ